MTVWEDLHEKYKGRSWLDKPSIFAEQLVGYLPQSGKLLDLGTGQGQDAIYFSELGLKVTAVDIEQSVLDVAAAKYKQPVQFQQLDIAQTLPFDDSFFDIVYSHLALHYFDKVTTEQIFDELYRVLKPGGLIAFLVNSIHDPEYGTGKKLEDGLFYVEEKTKRFFSVKDAHMFASRFEPLLADDDAQTYKDNDKGVHNLVRYIGKKT